jgi:acetyl esterase/lipase
VRQEAGVDPNALWGDPDRDAANWARHNPYDLAPDLRGTRVFVAAGDGRPGPLDAAGATTDGIEVSIGAQNRAFFEHLKAVGVEATVDLYGAGTHNWVYWQRELHRAWPLLTGGTGAVKARMLLPGGHLRPVEQPVRPAVTATYTALTAAGARRTVVLGASQGAALALATAPTLNPRPAGVVSLSAESTAGTIVTRRMAELHAGDEQVLLFPGSEHGIQLLPRTHIQIEAFIDRVLST